MDNLNHVKIRTPDPEAVASFLQEVCQIPEGWPLGELSTGGDGDSGATSSGTSSEMDGPQMSWDNLVDLREDGKMSGYIVGSPKSRQFQILSSDTAGIWGIAIGTRDVEGAYERAVARGINVTELKVVDWSKDDNIHAFFARVGGVTFEVMRVEPKT